jgi:predicted MPP superfamily phosphohydrolase
VTVITGDLIGEPEAVEEAVRALRPVRGKLASYFVLGSNDYFVAEPLNYLNYFTGKRKKRPGVRSRWREMVAQLEAEGWMHLRNRRTELSGDGVRFEVMGMDDPHIERHDMRVAPRRDPDAFGLAVVHSPDPAPELAALGYDLILSGHTHGGQVRLPVIGAIVTNSQMPTKLCRGLSRLGPSVLHVSPGLGTSKFAPFRFLCRPEATVLELAPTPVD